MTSPDAPPNLPAEANASPPASKNDADDIWEGWAVLPPSRDAEDDRQHRVVAAREEKRKAQQWVVDRLRREAPRALAGDPAAPPPEVLIKTLVNEIKSSFTGQAWAWRQNFLARGLDRGRRRLGWQVTVPPPVIRLKLPGSPLNPKTFPELSRFRALREGFIATLTGQDSKPAAPDQEQNGAMGTSIGMGTIFLSAVLFGGVSSLNTLVGIAGNVPGGIGVSRTLMWIDWHLGDDAAHPIWQRWLADPITALLIAQRISQPNAIEPVPTTEGGRRVFAWKEIAQCLESLNLVADSRPTSLQALLGWARTWYYRHAPAFLAAFASGQVSSANLPPHVWARLLGMSRPSTGLDGQEPEPTTQRLSPLQSSPQATTAQLYSDLLALRQVLRKHIPDSGAGSSVKLAPSRTTHQFRSARTAIDTYIGQPERAPYVQHVGGWLQSELYVKVGGRPARTLQSILRDLEAFDYELASEVLLDDPVDYDAGTFANVYGRVLDRASSAVRRRTRTRVLIRFHEYLVRAWGVPGDLDSVLDQVDAGGGVNANLIIESDFLAIWSALKSGSGGYDPERVRTHRMALLLSYRCGLRRAEAQQLRLGDITGKHSTELIVRSNRRKGLKTSNAQRRVPLTHLLLPAELRALREYFKDRRTDAERVLAQPSESGSKLAPDDLPLFPFDGNPFRPMPEAALFDPVLAVMRGVVNDPTLTQHHGRHGFVNRLTCELMEAVLPGSARLVDPDWTKAQSDTLRRKLSGGAGPNRQDLWIVSTIAGHATPEVTIASYFHLCDWLLYCATRRLVPTLTSEMVSHIIGLSVVDMDDLRRRGFSSNDVWFPLVLRNHATYRALWTPPSPVSSPIQSTGQPGSTRPALPATIGATTSPIPHPAYDEAAPTAANILSLLAELQRGKHDLERNARLYHVASDAPGALLKAAAEMRAVIGSSRSARAVRAAAPEARPSMQIGHLRLERPLRPPRVPLTGRDRDDLEQIYRSLQRLQATDHDSVDRFLTIFHARRSAETHEFRFGHVDEAVTVVRVLRAMTDDAGGPLLNDMYWRYVHQPLTRGDAATDEDQRKKWSTALDIPLASISQHSVALHRARGADDAGFLFVFPASYRAPKLSTAPCKGTPQQKQKAWSKGRGLALYAAAYVVTLMRFSGLSPAAAAADC